ncbi:imidazole glycerol phosphate synthase subunit HisH [Carboxydothermus hydrogenoformans]|uniref:Imidazole glycerol phosphate synthase subunit HisH n=1 Tax=Carboxydothermus hydrogenoformans (strain ATCC BAA-161 / DSM 6008 / Z-2901) TaxID=246194 RepID=HIS5_CARHZ|nr:imidazole glycerol phosphate synthase subunit HisH [Carboxydothermus hydrogenoformans]Q3AD50.1 RecName: Full=Imidazole glycerol phosphate synthase subunit HisH; AltName: Full=IGP synthase glutaminase subunit; AltName: Full=IGP synthase subunit HisH; AltName: Full=ImGP synthase subunit HisH; Short=IGPS subunit HisH [Carboxydothermus hydrogenoformans Z-2901]ABB14525.1 imidazole glycerol phosphate synthase, glutamine amidotransferase subunit [Carboxydothermus hydrogenoformans Z-2901]
MTVVVDYEMGNLLSVTKALEELGYKPSVTSDPRKILEEDLVVLPGVGAFRDAVRNLKEKGLFLALKERASLNRPILGICLGMQLFFTKSYEDGEYEGLDLIPGEVVRFQKAPKIPHMGWNNLVPVDTTHELFKNLPDYYVYFVHSYYAQTDSRYVLAYTEYGEKFPAAVRRGSIIGFQFHPEKSGPVGRQILKNLREML